MLAILLDHKNATMRSWLTLLPWAEVDLLRNTLRDRTEGFLVMNWGDGSSLLQPVVTGIGYRLRQRERPYRADHSVCWRHLLWCRRALSKEAVEGQRQRVCLPLISFAGAKGFWMSFYGIDDYRAYSLVTVPCNNNNNNNNNRRFVTLASDHSKQTNSITKEWGGEDLENY